MHWDIFRGIIGLLLIVSCLHCRQHIEGGINLFKSEFASDFPFSVSITIFEISVFNFKKAGNWLYVLTRTTCFKMFPLMFAIESSTYPVSAPLHHYPVIFLPKLHFIPSRYLLVSFSVRIRNNSLFKWLHKRCRRIDINETDTNCEICANCRMVNMNN